jgi:hypothetical protein
MSVYQLTNDELLTLGTRILDKAQAPTIRDAFAAAVQVQQSEYGEQLLATEALGDTWNAFHSQTYMP